MATVVKTWDFNSDNDGFTLTNFTRLTDDGSPDNGCLQNLVSARNTTQNATAVQTLTYEAMGVPSGHTITALAFKMYRRCAAFTGNITTFNFSMGSTPGTLFNQTNITAVAAWAQLTGNSLTGLSIASNTNCTLTLACNITTGGGGATPNVDGRFDTLELTITHEEAAPAPVEIAGRSATDTRAVTTLNTKVTLFGSSSTASRSDVIVGMAAQLSGVSATATDANISIDTAITLEGASSSGTRSDAEITLPVIEPEQIAGVSKTETRSLVVLNAKVEITGESSTGASSEITLQTPVTALAGRSATGTRATTNITTEESVATVWFQYRKVGAGAWLETAKQGVSGSGDFDALLMGLDPDTDYEFRAAATHGADTDYGAIRSFKTDVGLIELAGESQTGTRSDAILESAITLSGKSQTGTRSDVVVTAEIALSGESQTDTRANADIDVAAGISGKSATETRADIALQTPVTALAGISQTQTRATAEIEVTDVTRIAGVSRTETRAEILLESDITLAGQSSTETRSSANLITAPSIAGSSRTGTRSDIAVDTVANLAGISNTGTRSEANVQLIVVDVTDISGRSSTPTRADLEVDAGISLSGISSTATDSMALISVAEKVSGKSATATRVDATIDTEVSLSGSSRTATRTTFDLTVALSWGQFYILELAADFSFVENVPTFTMQEIADTGDFYMEESVASLTMTENLPDFTMKEVEWP